MTSSMQEAYSEAEHAVKELFGSKASPTSLFSKSEAALIERYRRFLVDKRWEETLDQQSNDAALTVAAEDNSALRKALELRRPKPTPSAAGALSHGALKAAQDNAQNGCSTLLATAPFSLGEPLDEEVGEDVTSQFAAEPLTTFSQLSLPDEGSLSLGAIVGTIDGETTFPAVDFGPMSLGLTTVDVHSTTARASLIENYACFPGGSLRDNTTLDVTVDVTIGEESRPFYIRGNGEAGITWVQGGAFLTILSPGLDSPGEDSKLFLGDGFYFATAPTVLRNFSLTKRVTLRAGTFWVSIGVAAYVSVRQIQTGKPNEAGVAIIDLRSPDHQTRTIHPVMPPGGPVRVNRISISLCPRQVLAIG